MRRWTAAFGLGLLAACGGSEAVQDPPAATPCGQVLGEILVQPLLDVHEHQVQIEVQLVTADETHVQSLNITWPHYAVVAPGTTGASPGAACGPPVATDTSVTGGTESAVVLVSEGTSGTAALPRVLPESVLANDGSLEFTNLGGPGTFTIAEVRRLPLGGLTTVPGGTELSPASGAGGVSMNYLLTDAAGRAQFLSELSLDAGTQIVSTPRIVTLENQTATVFVGTEVPTVAEVTQPHRDAVANLDPSITAVEAGVSLRFTPSVPQLDVVRLVIEPELATVVARTPPFLLNGVPSVALVPIVQTSQLVTQVLVPNEHTVIIGGLRDDTTMNTTLGVPILAKLPVVPALFRNHNQLDVRKSLMILVTPRIVRQ